MGLFEALSAPMHQAFGADETDHIPSPFGQGHEPGAVARLTEPAVTHDAGPSSHARDRPAKTVSRHKRQRVTDPRGANVGPAGHQEHADS